MICPSVPTSGEPIIRAFNGAAELKRCFPRTNIVRTESIIRAFNGAAELKRDLVQRLSYLGNIIRAFNGAAELKHAHLDQAHSTSSIIRAFNGAAELKLCNVRPVTTTVNDHPRLQRRGRIEA